MKPDISKLFQYVSAALILLFIDVQPAFCVYHYRKENIGATYLFAFTLFACVMLFFAIITYLCMDRKSPLIKAIEKSDTGTMTKILRKKSELVNRKDNDGYTPLIYTIQFHTNKASTAADCLIKNGADVNAASKDGLTPIFLAAAKGNGRIVQLLLQNGADSRIIIPPGHYFPGKTPLQVAQNAGHNKVVEIIMKHENKRI